MLSEKYDEKIRVYFISFGLDCSLCVFLFSVVLSWLLSANCYLRTVHPINYTISTVFSPFYL